MRLLLTCLLLMGAACSASRSDAPQVPAPPSPPAPGTVEAFVRVDGCEATRCTGTVVEIAGRGSAAPVIGVDQSMRFELDPVQQRLRQGAQPAFRPGVVLHLVLASGTQALGSTPSLWRIAEVRTPGLTS